MERCGSSPSKHGVPKHGRDGPSGRSGTEDPRYEGAVKPTHLVDDRRVLQLCDLARSEEEREHEALRQGRDVRPEKRILLRPKREEMKPELGGPHSRWQSAVESLEHRKLLIRESAAVIRNSAIERYLHVRRQRNENVALAHQRPFVVGVPGAAGDTRVI